MVHPSKPHIGRMQVEEKPFGLIIGLALVGVAFYEFRLKRMRKDVKELQTVLNNHIEHQFQEIIDEAFEEIVDNYDD
jgi:hypothetical protein